jgi:hypothetical protein
VPLSDIEAFFARNLPAVQFSAEAHSKYAFGLTSRFFELPFAQATAWGVDPQLPSLCHLREAHDFGHFFFVWHDDWTDGALTVHDGREILAHAALSEYVTRLQQISETIGRDLLDRHYYYLNIYAESTARPLNVERSARDSHQILNRLWQKSAPAFVTFEAISEFARIEPAREVLMLRALKRLATALQILDDLQDLHLDAGTVNRTWILAEVERSYPKADLRDVGVARSALEASGVRLVARNWARRILKDAAQFAEQAVAGEILGSIDLLATQSALNLSE